MCELHNNSVVLNRNSLDVLLPLTFRTKRIPGRNGAWRRMMIDAIRTDLE